MKTLVLFIAVLSASLLRSQTLLVQGLVQSDQNGAFVKNAMINADGVQTLCDSNGRFSFRTTAGTHLLKIRHPAYFNFSKNISFQKDTFFVLFVNPRSVQLDEITVQAKKDNQFGISRLNNVEGTTIYAGKKSEAVYLQDLNANLAANNSRQIFSKVAGINIFENDGSGSTIGIGGRGLNPNRISNFNTRQNGYDISADALGYPESYYTPPTEAISRIEILRGAAGLQFGTQFGGMINYRFTEAPADKKISGNFRQTAGSFGFFNSFNQLSGTIKKWSYNTFYQYKHYTGWRERSELNSHTVFTGLTYQASEKLQIKAELTVMNYLSQQAGGLTDVQFTNDASQVNRTRNWFRVNWNLGNVSVNYKLNERTKLNLTAFGLIAGRDALGVLAPPNRPDDTSAYRNLLNDVYKNHGAELRILHRYTLLKKSSHFLAGARYYKGRTFRKQGDAGKGTHADFRFINPNDLEHSSYLFPSINYALFAENIFQLSQRWSLTPGLRYEYIHTASDGYYRLFNRDGSGQVILDKRIYDNQANQRDFILAGIGTQYKLSSAVEVYANFSQNYRSINFNDMRVVNPNFQVDPLLKDENGYTADLGFRGAFKDLLYFDIGGFFLKYNNRIGTDLRVDSATFQVIRFRTNIADSRNMGVEAVAELDWMKLVNKENKHRLSTFVNISYINAIYLSDKKQFSGEKVEFVPDMIFRTGLTYGFRQFKFTCQYSYVTSQFSEATNAIGSPSGIYGLIPAYSVVDLSASYTYKKFLFSGGVNNLANSKYFTRRAEGYPGPGIIPADPINLYLTAGFKF